MLCSSRKPLLLLGMLCKNNDKRCCSQPDHLQQQQQQQRAMHSIQVVHQACKWLRPPMLCKGSTRPQEKLATVDMTNKQTLLGRLQPF
jgi:hypothetical protein